MAVTFNSMNLQISMISWPIFVRFSMITISEWSLVSLYRQELISIQLKLRRWVHLLPFVFSVNDCFNISVKVLVELGQKALAVLYLELKHVKELRLNLPCESVPHLLPCLYFVNRQQSPHLVYLFPRSRVLIQLPNALLSHLCNFSLQCQIVNVVPINPEGKSEHEGSY